MALLTSHYSTTVSSIWKRSRVLSDRIHIKWGRLTLSSSLNIKLPQNSNIHASSKESGHKRTQLTFNRSNSTHLLPRSCRRREWWYQEQRCSPPLLSPRNTKLIKMRSHLEAPLGTWILTATSTPKRRIRAVFYRTSTRLHNSSTCPLRWSPTTRRMEISHRHKDSSRQDSRWFQQTYLHRRYQRSETRRITLTQFSRRLTTHLQTSITRKRP